MIPANTAAILGATTWGTTLAMLLAKKGIRTTLLARSPPEASRLADAGELPAPRGLGIVPLESFSPEEGQALILAVPSASMRDNLQSLRGKLPRGMLVVSASKGLEMGRGLGMSPG